MILQIFLGRLFDRVDLIKDYRTFTIWHNVVHRMAWLLRQTTARSSNKITRNWVTAQKSRLNWKLKVSYTAVNAGITQSQARDTIVECRN